MARPAAGRRRRREEEEDDDSGRRGRGREKPQGPPAGLLLAGVGGVILAAGIGIVAANSKKKAPPPPPPAPVVAKAKPVEVAPPPKPTKVPPKPLTAEERTYIDGLFTKAKTHIDEFHKYAKVGWDLKGKGDNDGANDAWVKAKHEFQAAVGIVSEAVEDDLRFPSERPGMSTYNDRVGAWQKEYMALPKSFVK
jgi:hypothetical protein